jgi:hypothetical protein
MVNEVESILDEIRERVRSDHEPGLAPVTLPVSDEVGRRSAAPAETAAGNAESLSRLAAHLTTTARAWDRLPPLYSNRRGSTARLELWLKARLKSMTRWFTWEQVNFNSSVHQALSEILNTLAAHQQEIAGVRSELHQGREKFEHHSRELRAGIETLTAEVRKHNATLEARGDALDVRTEARAAELAGTMWKEIEVTRLEITTRLAELARELRENDEQLREEQRVCFKQLSLEASEAVVTEDRGRRAIEMRLDQLQKAVANGAE